MSGHNRRSKKLPLTKRRQTSGAISISTSTAANEAYGNLEPSQPSRLMDSSGAERDGSSGQEPSSGASSRGIPIAPLAPRPRYRYLCFRRRSPRTLVDGIYREHDPDIPEPLKWGFIEWARVAREHRGTNRPLDDPETLYNNRTLRFWKLSTDYGRFLKVDDEGQGDVEGPDHDNAVHEVVNGELQRPSPLVPSQIFWTSPQRPYTAPPHQRIHSP